MAFEENGWDSSVFAGRANSFRNPLGEEIGHGWVLMTREHLHELNTSESLTLEFGVGESDNLIQLNGIYVRGARRISPGRSHSDTSLYLVELVDKRYYLRRKRINRRFNCMVPGDTSGDYVQDTTNNGTPWTWSEVITQLWTANTPSLIGGISLPDLSDLDSEPQNLRYEGISAWEALNDACRRVGCSVVYDNAFADNFYVVRLGRIGTETVPQFHSQGGTDVTKAGVTDAYYSAGKTTRPTDGNDGLFQDEEVLQGDSMIPETVTVMFPTAYGNNQTADELVGENGGGGGKWYAVAIDGTNETELPASPQCDFYDSTASPATGRVPRPTFCPGTEVIFYETAHALFAAAGNAYPTNEEDLKKRAKEIARDVYRTLVDCAGAHVGYAGIHYDDDSNPTIPGKTVSEVAWGDYGNGFRTDIYREPPELLPTKPPFINFPSTGAYCEGRLLTEISAATNSLTGATEFKFVRFVRDDSVDPQATPFTLKEETELIDNVDTEVQTTGVNRDTNLTAEPDAYGVFVRVNGEWRPVWINDPCPA